jgi:hypothetical protein
MNVYRWIAKRAAAASLAGLGVALLAPAAFAQQGSEIFSWTGRVDREVRINVQNNRVWTQDVGRTEPGRARAQMISRMPRQDGQLVVQVQNGRGNVDVIQQPSSQNGYTAVVRVRDDASGSDQYRIVGYWQGYSNGDVYNRNNNGNGVGRGRGRGNGNDVYRDRDRDGRDDDAGRRGNSGNDRGVYGQNGNQNNQYANQALHWSGNVDGELEIRIQNGRVEYRNISGAQPTSIRADAGNLNMPRTNATVTVSQNQGRGSVFVAQQPSSWNGYTTVIRVRDPQGGYGFYDFSLMWQ